LRLAEIWSGFVDKLLGLAGKETARITDEIIDFSFLNMLLHHFINKMVAKCHIISRYKVICNIISSYFLKLVICN